MRIAVLGTGMVGRALAGRCVDLDHHVAMGTRDPDATRRRDSTGHDGVRTGDWLQERPVVELRAFGDLGDDLDLIVNATEGLASIDALGAIGDDRLAGRVILDVGNRLSYDVAQGPAVLATATEESLAERIQAAFPDTRVVKSLNTMTAALMVEPTRVADGAHTVFVSGDDAGAKELVSDLLRSFGWGDIVDLGPLRTARATEMLLPLWLATMSALQLPPHAFQFRIVR